VGIVFRRDRPPAINVRPIVRGMSTGIPDRVRRNGLKLGKALANASDGYSAQSADLDGPRDAAELAA
jgi:hypothetical protein